MSARIRKYPQEEIASRGRELYENHIRAQVEANNRGKIVAIDIDSGDFEVAPDTVTATDRLIARLPDAQIWLVRVGHDAVHRFGFRPFVIKP